MKASSKTPLKMKKRSAKGGMLVYAVIGNYKNRGKQKLILHEVMLEKDASFSYGTKRHWVFNPR